MEGVEPLLRTFTEADRDAVESLWRRVFPDDPPRNAPAAMIDLKLREQPELFLVAEIEGVVVGAGMAGFDGTRGWIHHLAVHPTERGRGIGTRLVGALVAGLERAGCPKVNLQIRRANEGAIAFYERLGFTVEDRVSMGRALNDGASARGTDPEDVGASAKVGAP